MALVAVKMTLVEYTQGDTLGKVLAHASLLPVFIAFGLGVTVLVRREIGTAVLLVGILANEVFNDVLKTAIAEPRPQRASERGVWGEYGMPSSHAQFMGFFVAYMTLWTLRRLRPRPTPLCGPLLTDIVKWLLILALTAAAALVVWSRVYLKYHTVEQVACGVAVGAAAGIAWYLLMATVFAPWFPIIEQSWPGRLLLLRDSSPVDDVFLIEYEAVQSAKRALRSSSEKKAQ